jgi:hypothetical protein
LASGFFETMPRSPAQSVHAAHAGVGAAAGAAAGAGAGVEGVPPYTGGGGGGGREREGRDGMELPGTSDSAYVLGGGGGGGDDYDYDAEMGGRGGTGGTGGSTNNKVAPLPPPRAKIPPLVRSASTKAKIADFRKMAAPQKIWIPVWLLHKLNAVYP